MKKWAFFVGLVFSIQNLTAQIIKPATWQFSSTKNNVNIGDTIELTFSATIDHNWYLYSSDFDPDLGPMLTEFVFTPNADYTLVGDIVPVNPKEKYDKIWEGKVRFFKDKGSFKQKIKITGAHPQIKGTYSYQVCSDVDGKCIPFEEDFQFDNIKVSDSTEASNAVPAIQTNPLGLTGENNPVQSSGILNPVSWKFELSNPQPKVGDEVDIVLNAIIEPGWHLYSTENTLDPGPIAATITLEQNNTYKVVGKVKSIGAHTEVDPVFEGEVSYFEGTAEFRQSVKILEKDFKIHGNIDFQVCSTSDGKCIPLDEDFSFGKAKSVSTASAPQTSILKSRDTYSPYSLLSFMIVAFLAGLAALLTPCVFPMIPMTVSFFTGRAKSKRKGIRNALVYGFSIIFIYTLIGSVLSPFMGPAFANELATNWIINMIFFIVFLVFALSFFGMFEITLPHAWVNKADQQADKGGIGGIFFMAFTLVLVSFSCTGPIVGSILVESAGGMILKPILGMSAFALAFAIPFTLFAIFPEWLNALPKSGGWLNAVKVVMGFIELAFALKFISIADQAYHWRILDREIYLAIWIVIFSLLGFYLLGKIRLPNDSELKITSVPRLMLAIIVFSFVVYLIPGMFGAPLKALAGYLPPMSTHDFNLKQPGVFQQNTLDKEKEKLCEQPKYTDFLHFPHGIEGYFDYQQALACSKQLDKPIFIDFTGWGCVNCREMEARVWSDEKVLKKMKQDFIMLALYVDDKTELPESAWYKSTYDQKIKKTIGKQNADLQITKFNNNAQPFYVIIDGNENILAGPKSYDLDINHFLDFLDEGLRSMNEK